MFGSLYKAFGCGLFLAIPLVTSAANAVQLTYTITAPASATTDRFWYSNPITFQLNTDNLGPDAVQNPGGFPGYVDVMSTANLPFQYSPLQLTRVYFQNYGEPALGYNAVLWLYSGAPGTSTLFSPSSYVDVSELLVRQVNHKLVFATGEFDGFDQLSQPLKISVAPSSAPGVPEPSTWVEMLVGSAATGLVLRARERPPQQA